MRDGGVSLALALVLASSVVGALPAHAEEGPRRWALLVGENEGAPGDEPLQYAESDARRMYEALLEVGRLGPDRATLLTGADAASLRRALSAFKERLRRGAAPTDELWLYVSSHADEGALHLRGTRLPLTELTTFLREAPVGVALLVVDSCRSGALTRPKGLRPASAEHRVEVEAGSLRGRVIITSSGPDEASQESDAVEGSYFSHHLAAALRGAADRSGDGRVTLEEGYSYAYARTLESTFISRGGLQRPSFKVDLHGHGELVLAEPGRHRAHIELRAGDFGQWLLLAEDRPASAILVESREGPVRVAVAPGRYRVRLRVDEGFRERWVTVAAGGAASIRAEELATAPLVHVTLRGASRPSTWAAVAGAGSTALVNDLSFTGGAELRLGLPWRPVRPVDQLALAVAYRQGQPLADPPFLQQELELRVGPSVHLQRGRLAAAVGPELVGALLWQSGLPDGSARTGLTGGAGLSAEGRLQLAFQVWLTAGVGGAVLAVKKQAGVVAVPRAQASLGLALAL